MSCYAMLKSTFLTLLLLSVSVASADDPLRQLRGVDDPTPAENKLGSKQDSFGQEEGLHPEDPSFDADPERRGLGGRRTVPEHHPHGAKPTGRAHSNRQNKPHPKKGVKPSRGARSNHVRGSKPRAKKQKKRQGAPATRGYYDDDDDYYYYYYFYYVSYDDDDDYSYDDDDNSYSYDDDDW